METYNNIKFGDVLTCIKNDRTNDNLITVGKDYKVIEISTTINHVVIEIMTDAGIYCNVLVHDFFISKRCLRKNKINKLNEIFCKSKLNKINGNI